MDDFLKALESIIRGTDNSSNKIKVRANGVELDQEFDSVEEVASEIAKVDLDEYIHFEFYQNDEKVGEYIYDHDNFCDDDEYYKDNDYSQKHVDLEYDYRSEDFPRIVKQLNRTITVNNLRITLLIERI